MSRTPTLAEVVKAALDAALGDVHVSMPARVLRYDPAKGLVDAQPLTRGRYVDEEGEERTFPWGVVTNVPVVFPSGGGFRITFPLQVGDTVCLLFAERSLDAWLSGDGGEVEDPSLRRHSLNDAVAIPGLRPFGNPLKSAPADTLSIGADAGVTVEITPTEIRLGGSATGVVKFSALKLAFDAHVHTSTTPGLPTSPPTVPLAAAAESGTTKTG